MLFMVQNSLREVFCAAEISKRCFSFQSMHFPPSEEQEYPALTTEPWTMSIFNQSNFLLNGEVVFNCAQDKAAIYAGVSCCPIAFESPQLQATTMPVGCQPL